MFETIKETWLSLTKKRRIDKGIEKKAATPMEQQANSNDDFSFTVLTFLIITYKKKTLKSFYDSGLPGFFGGIILSFGFCGYVFAMYNTTVANTNFIISLQILFLAIFGYFFLKEKISKITLVSIILAISGIILMVGSSLSSGQMSGNIAAFIMPISFAFLIVILLMSL